ncbi:MAG: IS21-like element helper ATPase IstB [Candidatus Acidiferrales bacterium]
MTTKQEDNAPNSLELSEGQLEVHFRRLNLAHTRRIYKEVADRAEKESWSYRDFLALLLAEEVARRKQTRLQRCTRSAHFPFFKTIDEFDFTLQSTLRESVIGSYLGLDFVTEGRSLILHGKTGRGKTHLAIAIGYRAIQNGFETVFTTAAELIEDLSNASKRGNLQESLATYTHPHALIIDEVGYLTYGPDAANVLFHVVNDRHLRKRPMIFTTNKPLNEWGKVLHDEDMAAAILDRVLERGRFIHLDGPSGRTRHLSLEENLPENTKRLRISGIGGSDFPEPTSHTSRREIATQMTNQGGENSGDHANLESNRNINNTANNPITEILKTSHTIAVVGLSSRKFRPSHGVAEYLQSAGYRIIPVNPHEREVLGEKSYARLEDIPEKIDIVDIFRRSEYVPEIVESVIRIKASAIWMQEGVIHHQAAEQARRAGIPVVMDSCILKEHIKRFRLPRD